ncbi:MAG: pyridoxamine 5'-phosphate oxidase family protein [Candidatus Accumulibacter sp.]|nr:pyridoxamine 5'-phosphate oxidase family protein [Accumulibacter sp.]
MSAILSAEVIDLLNSQETAKILATVDEHGHPHAVVKKSLHNGGDGNIHLLEILESSHTGRNLLGALWFGRKVSISLLGKEGRQVQIKGKPLKCHISGPLFQRNYVKLRERLGDVDLAAVWVIEPEEVIDADFAERKARQDKERPTLIHLDRLLKETAV